MGEAGPEAIMPLRRGPDGRLGVSGAGSAPNVTIRLENQTGTQMKQKDGGTRFDGAGMVKTIVLEAMDTDPSFRWAMRGAN
jgi:phage-related minor tail protein